MTINDIQTMETADMRRALGLVGAIFYYGNFKVETPAESELWALLQKLGYAFETEDQLMRKLHPELF